MNFIARLSVLTMLAFAGTAAGAVEWQVTKQQGRDYVSFGNVAEFYHFAKYDHANQSVSLQSERRVIRAQSGTSELTINGVRFFTHFPILHQGEESLISAMDIAKIVEPVLRPSRIPKAEKIETVILDPGHGGMDQGTAGPWGTEKDFALDVALRAREDLSRAGFKVAMTRSTDIAVSLEGRIEFANRFPHAVFVSIHFNSGGGGTGVESYLLAPEGVPSNASGEQHAPAIDTQPNEGNAHDGLNVALAAAVHASLLSRVSAFDRGVRHARFKVLRDIHVPAMLLEAGFLTNALESQRIGTTQYRHELGAAIAQQKYIHSV
jgi:N-acetylmuramoyl-L-alanine amidase